MYKRQFTIDNGEGREIEVFAENYMSMMEIATVAQGRSKAVDKPYDYFGNQRYVNDPSWSGFSRVSDLMDLMKLGVKNPEMVKNAQRYAHKAMVKEEDKYTRTTLSVAGGGVNVPLLLSGSPEVMYSRKKAPVRSKIINVGLDCEVTCGYTKSQYSHAGFLIMEVVSKLEKAGYRLRMMSMCAFNSYNDPGRINVLTTVTKKENEPMNYAKILFPMTEMSFFRGTAFAWLMRNPDREERDLGYHIDCSFRGDDKKELVMDMFEKSIGLKGFMAFRIQELIDMYEAKGDDATTKFIEAKLMSCVQ